MKQFSDKLSAAIIRLTQRLSEGQLMFVLSVIIGVLVGIAGHILKESIHAVQYLVTNLESISEVNLWYLITPSFGIILTVIFVRFVVKDNISHGITRILYSISRSESRIKGHNCYSSIVASATTIGFGGSVGAEAPIVLTGAAIGSNIGQYMGLKYNYITLLLGCGAAAAIAAVYKAPIAGFAFVLEVLMLQLTFTSIFPLLIASVTAATTTYLLVGVEPFFGTYTPSFVLSNIPYYAILGVLGGIVSYIFSSTLMKVESMYHKITAQWKKILFGGLGLGILIFIFPPLYGEGYTIITEILSGDFDTVFDHSLFYGIQDDISTMILYIGGILVFKFFATTLTNAAGGVGGTFAPSLFIGAMLGFLFAIVMNHFFGTSLPLGSFTLVGMATVMSGVMKAPLTAIFLVAELTGGFQLFLPLMLSSAMGFAISYYFDPFSIYTKRLAAKGELLTHNSDDNTMQFLDTTTFIETDFSIITPDGTLRDIIHAVENCQRNLFPVVGKRGNLVGIITMDDIRSDMFDTSKWDTERISNYVSRPPERILYGEDARVVSEKFEISRAWNLPVVDKDNKYIGFISKSRLLTAYREQLQQLSQN